MKDRHKVRRKKSGLAKLETRSWSPKCRAATMSDRRCKRLKTRQRINEEAVKNG